MIIVFVYYLVVSLVCLCCLFLVLVVVVCFEFGGCLFGGEFCFLRVLF